MGSFWKDTSVELRFDRDPTMFNLILNIFTYCNKLNPTTTTQNTPHGLWSFSELSVVPDGRSVRFYEMLIQELNFWKMPYDAKYDSGVFRMVYNANKDAWRSAMWEDNVGAALDDDAGYALTDEDEVSDYSDVEGGSELDGDLDALDDDDDIEIFEVEQPKPLQDQPAAHSGPSTQNDADHVHKKSTPPTTPSTTISDADGAGDASYIDRPKSSASEGARFHQIKRDENIANLPNSELVVCGLPLFFIPQELFKAGDSVLYLSKSQNAWFPATVETLDNARGEVAVRLSGSKRIKVAALSFVKRKQLVRQVDVKLDGYSVPDLDYDDL
mmetsp:Transcript_31463/g.55379  ORF Transcript_31463/g.55379 Transcript_31463/m.55379 type:complete len:328 (+) Transcript_31463:55-1038(+)